MTLALQTVTNTTLSNYSIDSVWAIVNVLNETLTHDWDTSEDDIFQFQLNKLNISGLTVWILQIQYSLMIICLFIGSNILQ